MSNRYYCATMHNYIIIIMITHRDMSIQSYMLQFLEKVHERLSQTVLEISTLHGKRAEM